MRNTLLVCAFISLASSPVVTQQTQLSVTTASPEALVLYQKALDYAENVESESARPLLDQAIQKDPNFAMAYALRADTGAGFNVSRENRDRAVSLVDKVSPGERHWIMAAQAQADGDVLKMKQHLVELLKLHPNDRHVAYFAGNASRLVDDTEALTYFKRATTIDPTFAAPYNQIGYIQLRKGDFPGAEQALKQYIANRPDSANPYDSYAELLLRMGRYDESIAQYEKALAKLPEFAGSLIGIGHNNVFKGDYAKARASYKRLYDTGNAPDKASSLYWTAVSFVHEGKPAEALQAFEQQREFAIAEKLTPTAMSAHLDQAWLLSESGKVSDAKTQIDKVEAMIDGAPFTDRAKANWRRRVLLSKALTAAQSKDFATAGATMDRAKATMTPDLPTAATENYESAMGIIDVLQGKYDAALPHLKRADPEDPYAMFYQAEAMRLKGDAAGAATIYKKVATSNQNGLGYALVRALAMKASGT
jgi:tetratricopeptide (TPR) repeat protein